MNLSVFSELLEDAGLGVRGTSIFVHRMDAECLRGILLREPLDGAVVDNNLPGYYKAPFQAIIRASTQADGDILSKQVIDQLASKRRRIFTDPGSGTLLMQVNHIYLDRLPIVYPRSVGQGLEWSCHFRMSYVLPT